LGQLIRETKVFEYWSHAAFCLPTLWKNNFVGRIDPKVDRSTGIFHIKVLHIEHIPIDGDTFLQHYAMS
jgi:uncharacterized protein YcaQ